MTIRDYIQDDYPRTAIALVRESRGSLSRQPEFVQLTGDAWAGDGRRSTLFEEDELSNARSARNANRRVTAHATGARSAAARRPRKARPRSRENVSSARAAYGRALALDSEFRARLCAGSAKCAERLGEPRVAAQAYVDYLKAPECRRSRRHVERLRKLRDQLRSGETNDVATTTIPSALVVASLARVAPCTAEAAHACDQEFESGATRPRTIAFLPPQAHARQAEDRAERAAARGERRALRATSARASLRRVQGAGLQVRVLTPEEVERRRAARARARRDRRRTRRCSTQVRMRCRGKSASAATKPATRCGCWPSKLGVDAVGFAEIQMYSAAAGASAVVDADGLRCRRTRVTSDLRQRHRRRDGEHRGVFRAAGAAPRLGRRLRRHHGGSGRRDRPS